MLGVPMTMLYCIYKDQILKIKSTKASTMCPCHAHTRMPCQSPSPANMEGGTRLRFDESEATWVACADDRLRNMASVAAAISCTSEIITALAI